MFLPSYPSEGVLMRRRAGGLGRGACARDSQPRSREASGNCPPYYEGRPVRAHGDRMNGGVSRRDQGERELAAGSCQLRFRGPKIAAMERRPARAPALGATPVVSQAEQSACDKA